MNTIPPLPLWHPHLPSPHLTPPSCSLSTSGQRRSIISSIRHSILYMNTTPLLPPWHPHLPSPYPTPPSCSLSISGQRRSIISSIRHSLFGSRGAQRADPTAQVARDSSAQSGSHKGRWLMSYDHEKPVNDDGHVGEPIHMVWIELQQPQQEPQ